MEIISQLSQVPDEEHWAVLEQGATHIPGDERSRTNPGHGYPESTEYHVSYRAFDSKEELENWIKNNSRSSWGQPSFRVIHVKPTIVETTVSVRVKS